MPKAVKMRKLTKESGRVAKVRGDVVGLEVEPNEELGQQGCFEEMEEFFEDTGGQPLR